MSDLMKMNSNMISQELIDLETITDRHDLVSSISTPKAYIKKKMDLDYVEIGYMKKQADKFYPGWSWQIISTEVLGTEAYVVHGRLSWFDGSIQRIGDMTAAHRIQKKKSDGAFVDIGNDIKAANTDCMKKAFNMYMNIADDVYRNQVEDTELTDEQVTDLITIAASISEEKESQISDLISNGSIHGLNYQGALDRLTRQSRKS